MIRVINGEEIVMMTREQADNINEVFDKQKKQIAALKSQVDDLKSKSDSLTRLTYDQFEWSIIATSFIEELEGKLEKYSKLIENYEAKKTTLFYWDDVIKGMEMYSTTEYIAYRDKKGRVKIKKIY